MATARKERHRSFDLAFKLRAIEVAEKKLKDSAAREFDVDPKRIREWCKKKEELVKQKKSSGGSRRKRLQRGGRKAQHDNMEESLFSWIMDLRERNLRVSRRMIVEQAKSLCSNVENPSTSTSVPFKASNGSLRRFMKRHGFVTST